MALITIPTTCLTVMALMLAQPSAPPPAAAQSEEQEKGQTRAVELRKDAEVSFYEGDYDTAIELFERAHELDADPTDLFNIGRIHEQQGELAGALARYEEFAALPELSLEERSAAAERIKVLRVLVSNEDAKTSVAMNQNVSSAAGAPSGGVDRGAAASQGRNMVIIGSTLLGVGAAAAIAGGVGFGLAARRNADQVSELAEGSNPTRLTLAEAEALDAQGKDYSTLQITFIVTGSALALVGAGVLAGGLVRNKRAHLSAISPVFDPHMLAVATQWRF